MEIKSALTDYFNDENYLIIKSNCACFQILDDLDLYLKILS